MHVAGDAGEPALGDRQREWLQGWPGRALSQVRFSAVSLVLDFWEAGDDCSVWVYADEVEVARAGADSSSRVPRAGAEAVGFMHSVLGTSVAAVSIARGALAISFDDGSSISVNPRTDGDGWALVGEAWGTILGGGLLATGDQR